MKSDILKGSVCISILLILLIVPFAGSAATMSDYCQTPPFIGTGGLPNVLMVADVSGSMTWPAYSKVDNGTAIPYVSTKAYEGYFDPVKNYYLESDGVTYREAAGVACVTTTTCNTYTCKKNASKCTTGYGGGTGLGGCGGSNPYGCCTAVTTTTTGDCGTSQTGNYLNWYHMHRIDLLRWSLTGGRPATCDGTNNTSDHCDPELWNQPGMSASGKIGTVCNNSLDLDDDGVAEGGCILEMDDSNGASPPVNFKVKVTWNRVYDGLVYQFMNLAVMPRLGVMSFDDIGVNTQKVYIGDFLSSNLNSATFPYSNFIANVNSQEPGGGTPTGPAMWDALNYFSQKAPQYGGFTPSTSTATPPTDRWKNPLYICDGLGGTNCQLNACARNYVILLSDGTWNTPSTSIGTSPNCTSASSDPVVPAYCMHRGFINSMGTAATTDDVSTKVTAVYTIGLFMNAGCGLNAMENIAMYGSFTDTAQNWPSNLANYPMTSCSCPIDGSSKGSLCASLPPSSPDWDINGDHIPDTFFSADDALMIKQNIMDAMQAILARATSGTAASVLASGEGSGANLVQATYYPSRKFFDASVSWIGGLQNLWYYLDPQFTNNEIREDDGDKVLHLQTDASHKDYITSMFFSQVDLKAEANLYSDTNGDGAPDGLVGTVEIDDLTNLWEAGVLLWNRDPATRTIYTPLAPSQSLTAAANQFSANAPNNVAALRPILLTDDAAASATENNQLATNIINYIRGSDIGNYNYAGGTKTEIYRPRAMHIDLNGNGTITDTSVSVGGVTMNETVANVWKLGDIINSTPKIASWVELNDYDTRYGDPSYASFITSATYTSRGMVYVGANDGMLHAFNLGLLQQKWSGQNAKLDKARLTGTNFGKEMWAFIPKNVLPYLKYLKDTEYCHISSVDLTPFLFDASIHSACTGTTPYWDCNKDVNSWRTILIGGMRFGGACKAKDDNCLTNTPNGVCAPAVVNGASVGYSSYFALDVTDPVNPVLLWEFNDPELGFTTPGPAVVKLSSRAVASGTSTPDSSKNGKWFVVLGSGPTGPIDAASQKFLGRSDQNLKLFVLDLVTGALASKIDTQIPFAFAGSMLNASHDVDEDYQDDVVYIPYVKRTGSSPNYTWTDGGVLRLLTNQNLNGSDVSATGNTALNPANWRVSKLIDGIGPVSSSVDHLYDVANDKVWTLFGTGRYFYKNISATDDQNGQRTLFSMTDPCWKNKSSGWYDVCLDATTANDLTRTISDLSLINLSSTLGTNNANGWYINLEGSGTFTYDENNNGTTADDIPRTYSAERVITDPLVTSSGIVFFTTVKPYSDVCSIGGKSFIWAAYYSTGAAGGNLLQGTALIQVSTGSIEQMKLSTAFTDKGGRRTGAIEGIPPTSQGLSVISQPNPMRRVLFMKEH